MSSLYRYSDAGIVNSVKQEEKSIENRIWGKIKRKKKMECLSGSSRNKSKAMSSKVKGVVQ